MLCNAANKTKQKQPLKISENKQTATTTKKPNLVVSPPSCSGCWEMCPLCVQNKKSITIEEHQVLLQWSGFALPQFSLARTTFPRIPSLRGLEVTFDHRKYFPELWKVGMKQELLSSEGVDNSYHRNLISCSWYWCEQWLDTTVFHFPAPIRPPSASLSPGSDAFCSMVKATSFLCH